jgi:UDP-N-acetylmuramate dehydrogenase
MPTAQLEGLAERVRGRVLFGEPLAGYTTYRIGGPAAALVHPAGADDVAAAVVFARDVDVPWLALGLGSNVLVSDRGFDGIVIRLGKGLDRVEPGIGGEPTRWLVGAGAPTPLVARRTAEAGCRGAQRLVGVPGTVGGGVFMNAGAHGQDFAGIVRSVEVVEADGTRSDLSAAQIPWRYRRSGLGGRVIVAATLEFVRDDPTGLVRDLRLHLRKRRDGTPFNAACCGSVFRNPAPPDGSARGRSAGELIDTLGLKGFRVGGAEVSPMHANYIVNTGGATARDVRAVIDAVRERVLREHGIALELEVQVIE